MKTNPPGARLLSGGLAFEVEDLIGRIVARKNFDLSLTVHDPLAGEDFSRVTGLVLDNGRYVGEIRRDSKAPAEWKRGRGAPRNIPKSMAIYLALVHLQWEEGYARNNRRGRSLNAAYELISKKIPRTPKNKVPEHLKNAEKFIREAMPYPEVVQLDSPSFPEHEDKGFGYSVFGKQFGAEPRYLVAPCASMLLEHSRYCWAWEPWEPEAWVVRARVVRARVVRVP